MNALDLTKEREREREFRADVEKGEKGKEGNGVGRKSNDTDPGEPGRGNCEDVRGRWGMVCRTIGCALYE